MFSLRHPELASIPGENVLTLLFSQKNVYIFCQYNSKINSMMDLECLKLCNSHFKLLLFH